LNGIALGFLVFPFAKRIVTEGLGIFECLNGLKRHIFGKKHE